MSQNPDSPSVIRIAAALLVGEDGRTLLVRKRGTLAFMQPGGKIEPHEEPVQALLRELSEELGIVVHPSQPDYLGRFIAAAANEPGWMVEAELFRVCVTDQITPGAEIEEIAWIDAFAPIDLTLAPFTRDHVLPLLSSCTNLS